MGGGGHEWLLRGRGTCMVAPGVCVVAPGGVCVVAPMGACVVAPGGARGCSRGHAWLLMGGGGVRGIQQDTEIRSMRGRYASYWNAFL